MKTIAEQHQGWCIHYRREPGMPKREACLKGIVYDDLSEVATKGREGCALRLPCVRGFAKPGIEVAKCEHMQFPTMEESLTHQREIEAYMEKLTLVDAALTPIRKANRDKDASGIISCPICQKNLHWGHAAYNNHMRVKCETDGCACWIE